MQKDHCIDPKCHPASERKTCQCPWHVGSMDLTLVRFASFFCAGLVAKQILDRQTFWFLKTNQQKATKICIALELWWREQVGPVWSVDKNMMALMHSTRYNVWDFDNDIKSDAICYKSKSDSSGEAIWLPWKRTTWWCFSSTWGRTAQPSWHHTTPVERLKQTFTSSVNGKTITITSSSTSYNSNNKNPASHPTQTFTLWDAGMSHLLTVCISKPGHWNAVRAHIRDLKATA